jgi:hypothetical protein
LPAALQTTISGARAALDLEPNDQKRAHHLIPANVWGQRLDLATLASQAGWRPDSDKNLIALPANAAAQAEMAAKEGLLPIHSSSHSAYDLMARGEIIDKQAKYHEEMLTPLQARAVFEEVAKEMERQLRTGVWLPKLR